MISSLDIDSSIFYPRFTEYFGLTFVNRARNLDLAVKQHLKKFPHSSVVNLGAGMDTGYFRINDSEVKWYDIDLPEAIGLKRKFVDETPNYIFIEKSVMDFTWFSKIDYTKDRGIIFLAGGLFMYFRKSEIIILLKKLAEIFPGGQDYF
ncbi:MAG: class I SAM-dependent methyltransferase [Candidatus Heimdallarchaeota archaeon]|nr:class I SAM-dependent methyltransferase [Candidatus Heimdallarchaeota archaeon]